MKRESFRSINYHWYAALIPFQQTIIGFEEARRRMETVEPQKCAAALAKMTADMAAARSTASSSKAGPAMLNRAAVRLSQLRNSLQTWFNLYDLYDPKFAWWTDGGKPTGASAADQGVRPTIYAGAQ